MQREESLGDLFKLNFGVPAEPGFLLEDGGRERGGRVNSERGNSERGLRRRGTWFEAAVDVANDGLKIALDDDLRYLLAIYLQILERQTRPVRFCCCC